MTLLALICDIPEYVMCLQSCQWVYSATFFQVRSYH